MTTPYYTESFGLRDGRSLGYALFGEPQGKPVFCYFGLNSRRYYPVVEAVALELKARLIMVDPPGIGLSDPQPGWTLLAEAEAVGELADGLGLGEWLALGIQAGGPRAAALAVKFPQNVRALSLVSCPAPPDAPIHRPRPNLLSQVSALLDRYRERQPPITQDWIRQNPIKAWQRLHHDLPEIDQEVFREFGPRYLKPAFMRDMLDEIYRQGLEGAEQAILTATGPWGFDLAEIKTPTAIWQGLLDETTPPVEGRYLAQMIRGSHLHEVAAAGHWWYVRGWQQVLTDLMER